MASNAEPLVEVGDNDSPAVPLALVTGASGYIASHIVQQILKAGKVRVRGTVRSLKNKPKVVPLLEMVPDARYPLELVEAELLDENCWTEVLKGVTYVYHVASPVLVFEDEGTLVRQSVEGTLNVLKACVAAGTVKRFVYTSSMSAVCVGSHLNDPDYVYTESDWSDELLCDGYEKSKLLGERAVMDFMSQLDDDKKFEFSVINLGAALGPLLTNVCSSSAQIVEQLLSGKMPVLVDMSFPTVDIRDVAAAHIRAMEVPEASGQRYLVAGKVMWMREIADVIRAEFEPQGYSIASRMLPKGLVWALKFVSPKMKWLYRQIGLVITTDCSKAKNELGIEISDTNQAIIDACYSLIERELVAKKPGYHGAALVSLDQPIEEPDKITGDKEDGKEEDEEEGERKKESEVGSEAIELTVPEQDETHSPLVEEGVSGIHDETEAPQPTASEEEQAQLTSDTPQDEPPALAASDGEAIEKQVEEITNTEGKQLTITNATNDENEPLTKEEEKEAGQEGEGSEDTNELPEGTTNNEEEKEGSKTDE